MAYDNVTAATAIPADALDITPLTLAFLETPRGRRNLLSESVLLQYGITVEKQISGAAALVYPTGERAPLTYRDGLWYIRLRLSAPPAASPQPSATATSTNIAAAAAKLRADDRALLWAARLDVDADGLLDVARNVRGLELTALSPAQRQAIASNTHRAIAQAKHAPVHSTPPNRRATRPAETLICDGFGKHHAASPIDGSVYQFSAVDEYSSYGYIASGKTHTISDWVDFLRAVVLDAKSQGHNPTTVRFDRAPELDNRKLKQRLEKELELNVQYTPREHHEGVGRAERNHDVLTRMAEAMLQRAGLQGKWLLPARAYAQWLLNRRAVRGVGESRYQRYLRRLPDLSHPTPLTFGTTVSLVEDVRGPKGSLTHPRGSIGKFIGIDGASYIVHRHERGGIVHQSDVRPLNELALIQSSLPSSVATVESATQTDVSDVLIASTVPAIAPEPAAARPAKPPPPVVDVPLNTRVEVLWEEKGSKRPVWYAGKVVDVHIYPDGHRRHRIAYDGWPEAQWFWHNLASADFEWISKDAATAANPTPAAQPSARSKRGAATATDTDPADPSSDEGPVTRSRRQLATANAAYAFAAAAAEAAPSDRAAERFDAALFQAIGDDAEPFLCSSSLDVAPALSAFAATACTSDYDVSSGAERLHPILQAYAIEHSACLPIYSRPISIVAAKATQNVVDVQTPIGVQQLTVPSSLRELMKSPQRDRWLAADQNALDAILAWPGNRLVSTAVPQAQGVPIAPCVTQRKLKIDPATKGLESRNAFKSRHCVDGGRLAALLHRAGAPELETSSAVACDLLIKMLLGDAATRDRNLLKADVPNAYPQGKRLDRPLTYMALPSTFKHMRADDGSELCIELSTPMWGEGPAGFEFQVELENTLEEIGWRRAEGVPALWTFQGLTGDAHLITIVDDLLFSESKSSGYSIAEITVAALAAKFGDLRPEREPTSYSGFRIERDRTRCALTMSLPQKIVEAAREHAPDLLNGQKLEVPSGARLQRMADGLSLAEGAGALNRSQRRTQQLIGSLKFIERIHPRASLFLHRLSCVMSRPPPDAYTVALAVLQAVYLERDTGITFGGAGLAKSPRLGGHLCAHIDLSEPAPSALEAHADATWGDRNLYGLLLTFAGAAILCQTKKIALIVDSSMETEAIASAKAGEAVAYAREILRAFGIPPEGPTLISTDNLANQRVGSGIGGPTRSKHFLRRYEVLKQRIREREVELRHVPDEHMPADFLTKFLSKTEKVESSIVYATNAKNRVASTDPLPEPSKATA